MATNKSQKNKTLRVGLVVPHIFMQRDVLPSVIFSPGNLAIELAKGLQGTGVDVTLFSPGPVETQAKNITADMSYFEHELSLRGDTYLDLLKKHPFTFITLARQVQTELIAKAYGLANADELDIIHIYTNEEDTALPFAKFCHKPVVFTHHDPFNFLVKYKNNFPKYKDLNWVSMSYAQRVGMPPDTNWVANIYHGLDAKKYLQAKSPTGDYVAFLGRIIEPKGVHLAIEAVRRHNQTTSKKLKFKIAGKHYAGHKKDSYWTSQIHPRLDKEIEYVGFINQNEKQKFIGNAQAVIVPSIFDEPFGLVAIEALACGTPVIGLDSGALPELVEDRKNGFIAKKVLGPDIKIDVAATAKNLTDALMKLDRISRANCRQDFENRFTLDRMCAEHKAVYEKLLYDN